MKRKLLVLLLLCAGSAFPQAEIDAAFGTDGKVVTSMGANNSWANAVTLLPDGKFLAGGAYLSNHGEIDFALARYNANGTLDTTFGIAGKVVTSFLDNGHNYSYIHSIHLLADGKFIVLGSSGVASLFSRLAIVRYNEDGSIDTGFGTNGKVISYLWPNSLPGNKLVFLTDGSFIVTAAKLYTATQNYDIGIEKYNANGALDTSFGTNGQVITSYGPTLDSARSTPVSIALVADGKFVVAGYYLQNNSSRVAVAQFNANGTLDTGFDTDGKVLTSFGTGIQAEVKEVFTGADGKITVAANIFTNTTPGFGLVRYNTNGTPDTAFDTDGMATTLYAEDDNYSMINTVTRLDDGKYMVVSKPPYFVLESTDFVIRKFNADATADVSFGTDGRASLTFDTGENEARLAAIATNGDILVAGKATPLSAEENKFAIAKFSASGVLDTSFGDGGKATTTFEYGNDELVTLLTLPDDKLVAVGSSAYRQGNNTNRKRIVLSKYNADGSLDTAFGTGGKVYAVFGENLCQATTAATQPNGKIVVGNSYYTLGQPSNSYEIIRYNANGSLDEAFGTAGRAGVNFSPAHILVQPDGKIIVTGDSYLGNLASSIDVVRFDSNGNLDAAFGIGGYASVLFSGASFTFTSALLQPDGNIVVCESIVNSEGVMVLMAVRLKADGSMDDAFGTNGILTVFPTGADVFVFYKCFLQADGKIIAAGRVMGSTVNFATMRLTASGAVDAAYGTDGIISTGLSEYREPRAVIMQPDGKFLVALSKYNQPQGSYDFVMRRFNTDGTFDAGFSDIDGITASFYNGYDEAFSIALQSDYKIVMAGSTFNGISKDFALARFTNDVVGAEDFESPVAGVTVYPNPAKDKLYIKAGQGVEVVQYAVYNMLGQMVRNGYGTSEIETANLANGIYTLRVTTTAGVASSRFVKE